MLHVDGSVAWIRVARAALGVGPSAELGLGPCDLGERAFVDSSHAEQGFYVVRVWLEDESSDDDLGPM